MQINLEAELLEFVAVADGIGLTFKLGDDNAADIKAVASEGIDETQDIHVVCDAEVSPHLVLLYIPGIDCDDDFGFVLQLLEHADLTVRFEPLQHS